MTLTEQLLTILSIRSEGLCDSCDYGIEQCLKDRKPFCKNCNKEEENEQEESI